MATAADSDKTITATTNHSDLGARGGRAASRRLRRTTNAAGNRPPTSAAAAAACMRYCTSFGPSSQTRPRDSNSLYLINVQVPPRRIDDDQAMRPSVRRLRVLREQQLGLHHSVRPINFRTGCCACSFVTSVNHHEMALRAASYHHRRLYEYLSPAARNVSMHRIH